VLFNLFNVFQYFSRFEYVLHARTDARTKTFDSTIPNCCWFVRSDGVTRDCSVTYKVRCFAAVCNNYACVHVLYPKNNIVAMTSA
jgi:hypothetical protein